MTAPVHWGPWVALCGGTRRAFSFGQHRTMGAAVFDGAFAENPCPIMRNCLYKTQYGFCAQWQCVRNGFSPGAKLKKGMGTQAPHLTNTVCVESRRPLAKASHWGDLRRQGPVRMAGRKPAGDASRETCWANRMSLRMVTVMLRPFGAAGAVLFYRRIGALAGPRGMEMIFRGNPEKIDMLRRNEQ